MIHTTSDEIAGRQLTIETGKLANQAGGSVTVRYGDSILLVTACAAPDPREGVDFLPLTIDYEERLYAVGKIPGSFFRREGRPTETATLAARLTDRPLRPLFPKGLHNEIQVVVTVLSADQENDPDILGIIGASASLCLSDIPFDGPVSATRLGYIDGEIVVNPTFAQLVDSSLDLVVAGTKDAIARFALEIGKCVEFSFPARIIRCLIAESCMLTIARRNRTTRFDYGTCPSYLNIS